MEENNWGERDLDKGASWVKGNAEYFDSVGRHVVAGCGFAPQDMLKAPPVAVVNQEFVKQFFGAREPTSRLSKDGRLLFGIREELDKRTLFSLDVATLKVINIHALASDLAPTSDYDSYRFSLTPDGRASLTAPKSIRRPFGSRRATGDPLLSRLGPELAKVA